METIEKVFTTKEVAEMLGLKARTIRKYVKEGWIKPHQYNSVRLQFRKTDIDALQVIMQERMKVERARRSEHMRKLHSNG